MTIQQSTFLKAASMCRIYSYMLRADLPSGADAAAECAVMLEEEAKLAPTITEKRIVACQVFSMPSMKEINGWCKGAQ